MRQATAHAQGPLCAYQNNAETFDWLYKKYWTVLRNLSFYYLKDHSLSEEIVQQLFIDIYRKNIRITETINIDSYLRKAIRNRAYNCILSNKRYRLRLKKLLDKTTERADYSIDNEIDRAERQQQINFYLAQLNESCRTVFLLNREEQLTIKEIAYKLQRPEDTVTKQLGKAVRHLYKNIFPEADRRN